MNNLESVKDILIDILTGLEIKAEISINEKEQRLEIDSADQALLIGKHGENLRSLQHILNSIAKKKLENYQFVSLDVAGYKRSKLEKVKKIAEEAAREVALSGREKRLPAMNSYERRYVHTVLSENSDIITESEGEEPHRTIVIKKS